PGGGGRQWPLTQTSPAQQSLLLKQISSGAGIQLTQVLAVMSQMPEQQSLPRLQVPPLGVSEQQDPLKQVWPVAQQTPLQQRFEQHLLFVLQPRPARWHLGLAKAVSMPLKPSKPARVVAAMVLRA